MADIKGISIAGMITPGGNDLNTFATHEDIYGKGGWRSVNKYAELDNISQYRLKDGMAVYVNEDKCIYIYNDGTWNKLSGFGQKVISKDTIYENSVNGSIYKYTISCFNDRNITAVSLGGQAKHTPINKKNPVKIIWNKVADKTQYIGLCSPRVGLDNEGYIIYPFLLTFTTEKHTYSYKVVLMMGQIYEAVNIIAPDIKYNFYLKTHDLYLELPSWFKGTVTLHPLKGNDFLWNLYSFSNEPSENTSGFKVYNWWSNNENETVELKLFDSIDGTDDYSLIVTTDVDIIYNDKLEVGQFISDDAVNDYLLHYLDDKINYINSRSISTKVICATPEQTPDAYGHGGMLTPDQANKESIYFVPVKDENDIITEYVEYTVVTNADGSNTWEILGFAKPEEVDLSGITNQIEQLDTRINSLENANQYLPLAGGQLTGDLIVGNASKNVSLTADGKISSGNQTKSLGNYSQSFGKLTTAQGESSHAEGSYTKAIGKNSHSEGYGIVEKINITSSNVTDGSTTYVLYTGIVQSQTNRIGQTLFREITFSKIDGIEYNSQYYSVIKNSIELKVEKSDGSITPFVQTENYYNPDDVTDGYKFIISFKLSEDIGQIPDVGVLVNLIKYTIADNSVAHAEGKNTSALEKNSHAEGLYTIADGQNSHVEGHMSQTNAENSHAEGYHTIADNKQAHAEGAWSEANAENSHAEGEGCVANGKDSHAEGKFTHASGIAAHAEGIGVETILSADTNYGAIGNYSHVQNDKCTALGSGSTACGYNTIAYSTREFVIGEWNAEEENLGTSANPEYNKKYYFVIGGGSTNADRKNVFTVDTSGNTKISGKYLSDVQKEQLQPNSFITANKSKVFITYNNSDNSNLNSTIKFINDGYDQEYKIIIYNNTSNSIIIDPESDQNNISFVFEGFPSTSKRPQLDQFPTTLTPGKITIITVSMIDDFIFIEHK